MFVAMLLESAESAFLLADLRFRLLIEVMYESFISTNQCFGCGAAQIRDSK